jgi:predicted DNA-binding protein
MVSKTAQSGRADFLLRMPPELKARLAKAADEDGTTIRDLVLYAIEEMLDTRDGEVAADKKRMNLEQRLEMKFEEIVVSLAGGDITSLSADKRIDLHYVAEAAIKKWRDHTATNYYAEPKTPIERLAKDYCAIEADLEDAQRIGVDTFEEDDGLDFDDDDDLDDAESA